MKKSLKSRATMKFQYRGNTLSSYNGYMVGLRIKHALHNHNHTGLQIINVRNMIYTVKSKDKR